MSLQFLTAGDLAKKVINKDDLFILDVRNEDAFNDWKIEGDSVTTINQPYFELLDGLDPIVNELPENKPIVIVCAKEGSSKLVGDMLIEAGYQEVFYLKDGMKMWSDHIEPIKVGDLSNGGSVYQFIRLGKGCLSYMIESDGEAIIIDPIRTADVFVDFAKENGLKIKHVIDTHLHADHISGARAIRDKTNATYWLPPKDAEEVIFEYEPLTENSKIIIGKDHLLVDIMYTPGHTIGSTSLMIDQTYLITGDILFVKSIGRPDLAGKADDWAADLRYTLYSRYKDISDELVVLPAHFSTIEELNDNGTVHETLGKLFAHNSGLQIEDETQFYQEVSEDLPPQPNSFKKIRQTNMGKENPTEDEQQEMEIGPNRCAVSQS